MMITKHQRYTCNVSHREEGFTLIELLITVAIVGIISAIAYPTYTQYVLNAGRSEGVATLLEVMERQEQHYRNNLTYTTNLSDLGYPVVVQSETDRYRITAMECDRTAIQRCVNLIATAQGRQATAGDVPLTLNSRGEKSGNWPAR